MTCRLLPEPLLGVVKRRWKISLLPLLVAALDIPWLKGYLRNKLLDWAITVIGDHGRLIIANPMAFTTIALGLTIVLLAILVIWGYWKESKTPSLIVDRMGLNYPRQADHRPMMYIIVLLIAFVTTLCYGTYKYTTLSPDLACDQSDSLPGFSWNGIVKLEYTSAARPKYLFDMRTSEGASVSIYVSEQDILTFAIVDVKSESFSVHVPLGPTGMPLGQYVYLSCQIGIGSAETTLAVAINAMTVERMAKPFRIDIGPVDLKRGFVIGNDLTTRASGATFRLGELKIYDRTLTESCQSALARYMHEAWGTGLPK